MKTIVKSLIYDDFNNLLVLVRSGTHPNYPSEDDLPGGEIEGTEELIKSVIREIHEETGFAMDGTKFEEVSKEIVSSEVCHILFVSKIPGDKPNVRLSWEHSSYKWVPESKKYLLKSNDDYISTINHWLSLNRPSNKN